MAIAASRRWNVYHGLGLLAVASASLVLWVLVKRRRKAAEDIEDEGRWQLVGSRSEMVEGPCGWELLTFELNEGRTACVLHRDGKWLSFDRSCPHAGIDLLGGDVEDLSELGAGVVVACPAHTYLFDPILGTCLWDASRGLPETPPLQTYEVRENRGNISVRPRLLPAPPSKDEWDQARADQLQLAAVDKALARKFPD